LNHAFLSFTHWEEMTDRHASVMMLRDAYKRNCALICRSGQVGVDAIIPILIPHLQNGSRIAETFEEMEVSAILIQFKYFGRTGTVDSQVVAKCNLNNVGICLAADVPSLSIIVGLGPERSSNRNQVYSGTLKLTTMQAGMPRSRGKKEHETQRLTRLRSSWSIFSQIIIRL